MWRPCAVNRHATCHLCAPPQIRTLTRQEVDDADSGDAALKLLSDLTVSMPQLVEMMQARVHAKCTEGRGCEA